VAPRADKIDPLSGRVVAIDTAGGDERGTAERVLTLLGLLQQRQSWTGPELADRLGVAPRTVRRDVERLRTLGYRIHSGQGVGGGYRLGPGQELPPLLLDDEEAIATVVSLLAGAGGGVAGSGDAALRALTELDQVLPARLADPVGWRTELVGRYATVSGS
jgi:predicted DNA-binding transcriptional regulator YafY